MRDKIIDVKLNEKEYTKILCILSDKILELNKQLTDPTNQEDLLNEIFYLKLMLTKIETAKLYQI